jgi:hypothetical protein
MNKISSPKYKPIFNQNLIKFPKNLNIFLIKYIMKFKTITNWVYSILPINKTIQIILVSFGIKNKISMIMINLNCQRSQA